MLSSHDDDCLNDCSQTKNAQRLTEVFESNPVKFDATKCLNDVIESSCMIVCQPYQADIAIKRDILLAGHFCSVALHSVACH